MRVGQGEGLGIRLACVGIELAVGNVHVAGADLHDTAEFPDLGIGSSQASRAGVATNGLVAGEQLEHAEVVGATEEVLALLVVAISNRVHLVIDIRDTDRAVGVVGAHGQHAAGFLVGLVFGTNTPDAADGQAAEVRRAVGQRVVDTLGGSRLDLSRGGTASYACTGEHGLRSDDGASGGFIHVSRGVARSVLTTDTKLTHAAVQGNVGLAMEGTAAGARTVVDVEALLEHELGLEAVAQVFRTLEAQTVARQQATVNNGLGVAVASGLAIHETEVRVSNTVDGDVRLSESRGGNQTGNSQGDQFFLHVFLLLNEVGTCYRSSLTYLSIEKLNGLCRPSESWASRKGEGKRIASKFVAWMQQTAKSEESVEEAKERPLRPQRLTARQNAIAIEKCSRNWRSAWP